MPEKTFNSFQILILFLIFFYMVNVDTCVYWPDDSKFIRPTYHGSLHFYIIYEVFIFIIHL